MKAERRVVMAKRRAMKEFKGSGKKGAASAACRSVRPRAACRWVRTVAAGKRVDVDDTGKRVEVALPAGE
eukprot:358342-Chlamydomonas_euryale.AAC.4